MKVCCGITLFYPLDKEIQRVIDYANIFELVFVFDNTDSSNNKHLDVLKSIRNIVILGCGVNHGLSKSLNSICMAAKEDFDFVCVLDQDSIFASDSIRNILTYININDCSSFAIVAPDIVYSHMDVGNSSNYMSTSSADVEWVITSGSFINLCIYESIGGFDENYFIDRLEYDYCMKARSKNYRILKVLGSKLYQELGSPRCLFFFDFYEHSPLRNYYIFRNRMYYYICISELGFFSKMYRVLCPSLFQIAKIIFFESEKLNKIKFLYKAIKHFVNGKYGKYDEIN